MLSEYQPSYRNGQGPRDAFQPLTPAGSVSDESVVQVDKDIERVTAENKKCSQQWQGNLLKLQKLDAKIKVDLSTGSWKLCRFSLTHTPH